MEIGFHLIESCGWHFTSTTMVALCVHTPIGCVLEKEGNFLKRKRLYETGNGDGGGNVTVTVRALESQANRMYQSIQQFPYFISLFTLSLGLKLLSVSLGINVDAGSCTGDACISIFRFFPQIPCNSRNTFQYLRLDLLSFLLHTYVLYAFLDLWLIGRIH